MGVIIALENVNNVLGISNKAVERSAGKQPDIYPGLQESTSQKHIKQIRYDRMARDSKREDCFREMEE